MSIPRKTLADLGWETVLVELARRCHTHRGEAVARELPLLDDIEQARARLIWIRELRELRAADGAPPFGGIEDVGRPVLRAGKGSALDAPELIAVARTVAGCGRLKRHLAERAAVAPALAELVAPMPDLTASVARPILDSFDSDGQLVDGASERLRALRHRVALVQEQLGRRAQALIDDPRYAEEVQDRFYTQRDQRTVIPVRADAPKRLRGIVHGRSQSGQTLFVEPEPLIELNNDLAIARAQTHEEELRILAELSGRVGEQAEAIRDLLERATDLDLLDAGARLAEDLQATEPQVERGCAIQLGQMRHPGMTLSERGCVANDMELAAGTTLIISGPNAGGKTVTLKTVGLIALMVRAGLPVPAAAGALVPWFERVHTDIGDDQSVERNLSTFSAHVLHLQEMLEVADADTLYLIDEVAAGTAPEQGAALAQAVLEALGDRGARGLVTTHYEAVKGLGAGEDPRFASASVGFDMQALAPTFRLYLGATGSSGALMVARRLGLYGAILERAEALLGQERASVEELLAAAAEERRRLVDEREQAQAAIAAARSEQEQAEAARRTFERKQKELQKGAHGDAVEALRMARAELDRVKRSLRRRRSNAADDQADDLAEAKAQVSRLAGDIERNAPRADAPIGLVPEPADLAVGAVVSVASLGARGTVAAPVADGRVVVQLGTMRTTVSVADLRLESGKAASQARRRPQPAPAPRKRGGASSLAALETIDAGGEPAILRTADNSLDLRGERVEEAVERIERFLDAALLAERDVAFVIHGHGTGALRKAVRSLAASHPAVRRWRAGELSEGGEGVTIMFLDV